MDTNGNLAAGPQQRRASERYSVQCFKIKKNSLVEYK